jgi:prepilin peptidase CpaA
MRYFPDPTSGWLFLGALASVLAIAGYTDERWMKVPKWLTVPALLAGLLVSCIRGGMLAAHGMPVWLFDPAGVSLGVVDSLLFALAGAVTGFGLFFASWLLGFCGGGDVKLFTGVGAWLGPYLVFLVLVLTLVLVSVCLIVVVVSRLVSGKSVVLAGQGNAKSKRGLTRSPVVVRFSLVAMGATLLVALWSFRGDLGLTAVRPVGAVVEVTSHAR